MAKKATDHRTPSRIIWDMIAAEMTLQHVTQRELAKRAKVAQATVTTDGQDPEKMPMWRVWRYFAILGLDPALVLRPFALEHAEKLIRREPEC